MTQGAGEKRAALNGRPYPVVGQGDSTPPQYERVMASLSDRDIEDELAGPKAKEDAGWRDALQRERRQRANEGTSDGAAVRSARGAARPTSRTAAPHRRRRRSA